VNTLRQLIFFWFLVLASAIGNFSYSADLPDMSGDKNAQLVELSQQLTRAKLKKIQPILVQLERLDDKRVITLFEAILAAELYYLKSNRQLLIAVKNSDGHYDVQDLISDEVLGDKSSKEIKKVRSNNKIRSFLRASLARMTLYSDQPELRQAAVENILKSIDADSALLLKQARKQESQEDILALIDTALALHDFQTSDDVAVKLLALETLRGSLQPAVRNALVSFLEPQDAPELKQSNLLLSDLLLRDLLLKDKVQLVLRRIESKIQFYSFLETLFFGLSLGSVLMLAAIGLAITFGVMGVINMAHGELIMLGAYTTYVVQLLMPNHIEYSILVAIPAAFIVSGSVGIAIERGVIRFLHSRPLETLLATFGVSLILQQAVRSIFSPLNRQVETPHWMSGSLEFNPIFSITFNRLYILIFAIVVFVALLLILKKTALGLNVRAVSQNRDMAKAIGIRTEWVDAMTFGLGSGIAGLAGVAISQLSNVGPNLGQAYIIDSFMVVVFGGVGNLWGTFGAGMSLGMVNKFLEPETGAVLANILILVFIILFIQKRPRGLFPQKGRAAE